MTKHISIDWLIEQLIIDGYKDDNNKLSEIIEEAKKMYYKELILALHLGINERRIDEELLDTFQIAGQIIKVEEFENLMFGDVDEGGQDVI